MYSTIKSAKALQEAFEVKLDSSGITLEQAKQLGFKPHRTATDLDPKLPPYAGFVIPYYDVSNKRTPFYRFRFLERVEKLDAASGKVKELRYTQPSKQIPRAYFAPLLPWALELADVHTRLVITEGELKAAAACLAGFHCIGLGGVWNFMSNAARLELLPELEAIKWTDRDVCVCYDSDAATNTEVIRAMLALAKVLTVRGAHVRLANLPNVEGLSKTGIDDYLVHHGAEALARVFDAAEPIDTGEALWQMNQRVVFIEDPGLIVRLDTGLRISAQNFQQVHYANYKHKERTINAQGALVVKERKTATAWIEWPHRFTLPRLLYAPGKERITPEGFNTWRGWGCKPLEGDIKPWSDLLDHLFGGKTPARKWFEQWCAYPLQFPGTKLFSTAVLWGYAQGTGKSLVGYTLMRIYGENAAEITEHELFGTNNDWAESKQFVMADEVTSAEGKRMVADKLKTIITREKLRINIKYVPTFEVPDCINYYFTSNHSDSFLLEDRDRRYFVHEVVAGPKNDHFYEVYDGWLKNDGPRALFHYLLHLDLTGFNPRAPALMTEAKERMIEESRTGLQMWVRALLTSPDSVLRLGGAVLEGDLWSTTDLLALYDPEGRKRVTGNALARELRRAGAPVALRFNPLHLGNGEQVRLWVCRNAEKWPAPPAARHAHDELVKAAHAKAREHYTRTRRPDLSGGVQRRKLAHPGAKSAS